MPVPNNTRPSAISYKALGRLLDAFATDLGRAESTLASIKADNVKLRLRLAPITFDFSGTGNHRTTLMHLLTKLNGGRFSFSKDNPDFRIHFDRGDAAWLRAYCHLLSAIVEAYRSVDEESGFEQRVKEIFPRIEEGKKSDAAILSDGWPRLKVVDAPRLRRARLHLVAVCELNRETWKYILAEPDDDYEWLPNPRQKDQLGLPIRQEQIDGWLAMMNQLEGSLKGKLLINTDLVRFVYPQHQSGMGLNLKRLMDDPPTDLLNIDRVAKQGIDAKYLEHQKDKNGFDPFELFLRTSQLFDGPFSFAYAARLN